MPGGTFVTAGQIAAYFRQNGTLPKATAMPESEEDRRSRILTRVRLVNGREDWTRLLLRCSMRRAPGGQTGHVFHRARAWQERRDELSAWIETHKGTPA